eukprot:GILI01004915.1.p1 GENE.GILI01004915.1~~GILI01004915.1.p1  ORF type:complete len:567 (-),score=125.91 GILI01004915.1:604-2304(-)
MGCGASQPQNTSDPGSPGTKYENNNNNHPASPTSPNNAYGDTDSEKSRESDNVSVSSNKFTVTTVGGKKYEHSPNTASYRPGLQNVDEEIEKWKAKNRKTDSDKKEEAITVDDFVFGDFKVDPGDVQKQRVERVNRVRMRRSSITVKKDKSQTDSVVFNDFVIPKIDEEDEVEYTFYHEKKVPPGFRRIHKFAEKALLGHSSRVKTIAISPNDLEYASAAIEDCHLTMTSLVRDGEETGTFIGHSGSIISAVFSRDGRYLATSSRDNSVIVWNMSQKDSARKQVRTLEHPSLPICAAFSYDGALLITGGQDRICRVWDIESREELGCFEEHEGVVVCVATVPGMDAAVSGGGDRIIRMWTTTRNPQPIRQFIGHDGVVISISITPDGEKLLSNDDRACKMWNINTGACLLNVTLDSLTGSPSNHRGSIHRPEFTPPMPLTKNFLNSVPTNSRALGMKPNGILGSTSINACKIGANRAVFTLSCLCPGELSCSYFAVACTNRVVYIVSCATGHEELSFHVKASVFAINAGRDTKLLMGDIFGNCYQIDLYPEGYKKEGDSDDERSVR